MSTKADRAFRAKRHILPIKVDVRQKDGRVVTQVVDADVREDKRARKIVQLDDENTGECPDGCGEAAYPFGCDELDGYVDAAPECAAKAIEDALANQV